ncbi:superoxide dismutase [Scheffersomyces xylosifermentans]|uniref:superoxide dismutase n=1 Tax=Scheffersomyces xylosifermentans TaxID=1304137 RepID=UPI00315D3B97
MKVNIPLVLSMVAVCPYLVSAGKAPKVKKNPKNVVAIADFPFGFDKGVKGNVVFSAKSGKTVKVHVDMTGLPPSGGPFFYHIHDKSVPGDGNCEAVGLHFNPYGASADCESQKDDSYCQVGDLSGKHGWIDTTCFETKYDDPFLSLNKKSKSYIVGKSVVFHFANMTKFACADIELANNLRLSSLVEEYQLDEEHDFFEPNSELADAYEFDEDEALASEVFELSEKEQQEIEFVARKELEGVKNETSFNFTIPVNFTNGTESHLNHSNSSNLSANQYDDWESGASSIFGFGLSVASAFFASLLI